MKYNADQPFLSSYYFRYRWRKQWMQESKCFQRKAGKHVDLAERLSRRLGFHKSGKIWCPLNS